MLVHTRENNDSAGAIGRLPIIVASCNNRLTIIGRMQSANDYKTCFIQNVGH